VFEGHINMTKGLNESLDSKEILDFELKEPGLYLPNFGIQGFVGYDLYNDSDFTLSLEAGGGYTTYKENEEYKKLMEAKHEKYETKEPFDINLALKATYQTEMVDIYAKVGYEYAFFSEKFQDTQGDQAQQGDFPKEEFSYFKKGFENHINALKKNVDTQNDKSFKSQKEYKNRSGVSVSESTMFSLIKEDKDKQMFDLLFSEPFYLLQGQTFAFLYPP
jgi:hypothetical protein